MKKNLKLALFGLILTISCTLYGQNLVELKTIEIKSKNDFHASKISTAELQSTNKSNAGRYAYVSISDFIDSLVPKEKRNDCILKFENKDGGYVFMSANEANGETVHLPPMLILNKVAKTSGDTVTITEMKGKKGSINLEDLEIEAEKVVISRLTLRIKSKQSIIDAIEGLTIIFPEDINTKRWLKNIVRLKLFIIQ